MTDKTKPDAANVGPSQKVQRFYEMNYNTLENPVKGLRSSWDIEFTHEEGEAVAKRFHDGETLTSTEREIYFQHTGVPATQSTRWNTEQARTLVELDERARDVPWTIITEERYVTLNIADGKRLIAVRSEMATGKTEWLSKLLTNEPKVLLIGHRKTLLRQAAKRLDLDYYEDMKAVGLSSSRRIAVTLDSLPGIDTNAMTGAVVVIDESEQVLQHLIGDTVKNDRWCVFDTLVEVSVHARRVITCDAHLSQPTFEFLRIAAGQNVDDDTLATQSTLFLNGFKLGGIPVRIYTQKRHLLQTMMHNIGQGRVAWVNSNSRKQYVIPIADLLRQEFPDKPLIVVHGDNSQSDSSQEFVSDINFQVTAYDVIVTSPSVGTGVSVDVEHVQDVYIIADHGITTAEDILQAMRRVRKPEMIHLYVSPAVGSRLTVAAEIERRALELAEMSKRTLSAYDHEMRIDDLRAWKNPYTRSFEVLEPHFLRLWSHIMASRNESLNNLQKRVLEMLAVKGFPVTKVSEIDQLEERDVIADLKGVRVGKDDGFAELVKSAPDMSEQEYDDVKRKQGKNLEDKAAIVKHLLTQRYGLTVDDIDQKIVDWFDDGIDHQVDAFTYLMDMDAAVRRDTKEHIMGLAEGTGMPLFSVDKGHHTVRSAELRHLFGLLGYHDFTEAHSVFATEMFTEYVEHHKEHIQTVLGMTVDKAFTKNPYTFIQSLFRHIGCPYKTEQPRIDGKQVRVRKLDGSRIELLRRMAHHREHYYATHGFQIDTGVAHNSNKNDEPLLHSDADDYSFSPSQEALGL